MEIRGVVDIEQDRIEPAARTCRIEAGVTGREREEITRDEAAAAICRQAWPEWHQARLVPADHRRHRLDDQKLGDAGLVEHAPRRVAEPEPADDDAETVAGAGLEPELGERDLGGAELARHQECIAELYLEEVLAGREVATAPEAQVTHRRRYVVQLLEGEAHDGTNAKGQREPNVRARRYLQR